VNRNVQPNLTFCHHLALERTAVAALAGVWDAPLFRTYSYIYMLITNVRRKSQRLNIGRI
jgi:hypothetical protein